MSEDGRRLRTQRFEQHSGRARAVRVLGLPLVAELGNRAMLVRRDEDRVVAEPLAAGRRLGDPAFEDSGAPELAPVGRDEHELGAVARAAVLRLSELRA